MRFPRATQTASAQRCDSWRPVLPGRFRPWRACRRCTRCAARLRCACGSRRSERDGWHRARDGTGSAARWRLRTRRAGLNAIQGDHPHDELDAAQTARDRALEEAPPVNLGLGQGHGNARNTPPLVRTDADSREHVRRENDPPDRFLVLLTVPHDPAVAHLLVPGVEDEVFHLAQRAVAPCLRFLIEQLGSPADLGGRQALDPELAHDSLGVTRRDAFDVHLGHRQHDGPDRPPPAPRAIADRRALPRARRSWAPAHSPCPRACRSAWTCSRWHSRDARRAPVMARAEKPLALDLHRKFESPREHRCDLAGSVFDQLLQDHLKRRILPLVHSFFSMVVLQLHGIPEWAACAGARPSTGSCPKAQMNFQT